MRPRPIEGTLSLKQFCTDSLPMLSSRKSKGQDKMNLKCLLRKCKTYSPELTFNEMLSVYYTEERKKEQVKTARAF